ncbi:MAG TPA: hypothetical protein VF843_17395 [Streptosporangiaceae bacterium]
MAGQRAERAVTGGRGRGPRGQQTTLSAGICRCPIPDCGEHIDPSRLMCRQHWYMVPKLMRDHVWATWRSGAAAHSSEHQDAVHAAVVAVLAATGQKAGIGIAG